MTRQSDLQAFIALEGELEQQVSTCLKRDIERDVNCDLCIFNLNEARIILAAITVVKESLAGAQKPDADVVERVAKAIYATKGYCYADKPFPWEDADEIVWEGCRTEARAAIAAMNIQARNDALEEAAKRLDAKSLYHMATEIRALKIPAPVPPAKEEE